MPRLSVILTNSFHAAIVNETGLSGAWKINLKWSRPDIPASASATDVPELSLAVKEQLGLRLVKREVSAEILLIESIQKPSAN